MRTFFFCPGDDVIPYNDRHVKLHSKISIEASNKRKISRLLPTLTDTDTFQSVPSSNPAMFTAISKSRSKALVVFRTRDLVFSASNCCSYLYLRRQPIRSRSIYVKYQSTLAGTEPRGCRLAQSAAVLDM